MGKRRNMNDLTADPSAEPLPEALLEQQIDALIEKTRKLRVENRLLRQQQEALVNERALLVEKVERARARIEAIMTRLRNMETHQ